MTAPRVSVVIPTYNRVADLERTLRGYERQEDAPPFEVVVVDDGSTDDTPRLLAELRFDRFPLRLARQENSGPARARNLALTIATGERALFTGDDVEPGPDLLARHQRHADAESDAKVAIVGRTSWPEELAPTATMRHVDGRGAQQFSFLFMKDGEIYDYRHFYTANVAIDRDFLLSEPGPFDTAFPHAAFEDAELALRLSRRGLRLRYRADAVGRHWHRYDAASFFLRQRRCGEMAAFLIDREPATAKILGLPALESIRRKSWLVERFGRGRLRALAEQLEQAEESARSAACALDAADDDTAFPLLFGLFNYGYSAGLADRRFPPAVARRVRAALFAQRVLPHVSAARATAPPAHG
jgi:glycosyltransferase involved in cell wall biosynthesis